MKRKENLRQRFGKSYEPAGAGNTHDERRYNSHEIGGIVLT